MSKKLLLVNLHSSVREFCLQERHKAGLMGIFKQMDVHFAVSKDDFKQMLPKASVVLVWTFQKDWYVTAPLLEMVLTPAAGRDWAQEDPTGKVPVRYGRFHGSIIAETVLGMMLHFNRIFSFPFKNQGARKWERNYPVSPVLLRGQNVVVVGYGAIGRHIAALLAPFRCHVTGVKRTLIPPDQFVERIVTVKELHEVLPGADHVVLVLPGGEATTHLMTKKLLGLLKTKAYIYNVGRGNCMREEDILDAVQTRKIAGAYLDVFDPEPLPASSPLWGVENIIITPHSSAYADVYLDFWFKELEGSSPC